MLWCLDNVAPIDGPPLHLQPRSSLSSQAARNQVAAAIWLPMLEGRDKSHWIAATSIQPVPTLPPHDVGSAPGVCICASTVSSTGGLREGSGERTPAAVRSIASVATGARSSAANTTHEAPAVKNTAVSAGGRTATAKNASSAVDNASRPASATSFPARNEGGREARTGVPAAPVAMAVSVPSSAVVATNPAKPADHHHQHNAPLAPGAVETNGGKKRRRVSGVACLRGFNRQGLAEDGPSDERRSGKRASGLAEEGATRGRTSKRARQPKVPWTE